MTKNEILELIYKDAKANNNQYAFAVNGFIFPRYIESFKGNQYKDSFDGRREVLKNKTYGPILDIRKFLSDKGFKKYDEFVISIYNRPLYESICRKHYIVPGSSKIRDKIFYKSYFMIDVLVGNIGIEYDGKEYHRSPDQIVSDTIRDEYLNTVYPDLVILRESKYTNKNTDKKLGVLKKFLDKNIDQEKSISFMNSLKSQNDDYLLEYYRKN